MLAALIGIALILSVSMLGNIISGVFQTVGSKL